MLTGEAARRRFPRADDSPPAATPPHDAAGASRRLDTLIVRDTRARGDRLPVAEARDSLDPALALWVGSGLDRCIGSSGHVVGAWSLRHTTTIRHGRRFRCRRTHEPKRTRSDRSWLGAAARRDVVRNRQPAYAAPPARKAACRLPPVQIRSQKTLAAGRYQSRGPRRRFRSTPARGGRDSRGTSKP